MEAVREGDGVSRLGSGVRGGAFGKEVDGEAAFAEMVGLLAGFDEAGAGCGREAEAVLEDSNQRTVFSNQWGRVFEADDRTGYEQALVALLGEESKGVGERELFGQRQVEGDEEFRVWSLEFGVVRSRLRRLKTEN